MNFVKSRVSQVINFSAESIKIRDGLEVRYESIEDHIFHAENALQNRIGNVTTENRNSPDNDQFG